MFDPDEYFSEMEYCFFAKAKGYFKTTDGEHDMTVVSLQNRRGYGMVILDGHHHVPYNSRLRVTKYPDRDGEVVLVRLINPGGSLGKVLTDRRPFGNHPRFRVVQLTPGVNNAVYLFEGTVDDLNDPAKAWGLTMTEVPENGMWWFERFDLESEVWSICPDPRSK